MKLTGNVPHHDRTRQHTDYLPSGEFEVLSACFGAGFFMDGIEEPVFPEGAFAGRAPSDKLNKWRAYRELPPVLAARLRLSPLAP